MSKFDENNILVHESLNKTRQKKACLLIFFFVSKKERLQKGEEDMPYVKLGWENKKILKHKLYSLLL